MKKYLFSSLFLISAYAFIMHAQTPFDVKKDYLFADFEPLTSDLNRKSNLLDAKGNSTDYPAISGAWETVKRVQYAGNTQKSDINPSSGCFRFGIMPDKSYGGIFINLEDWSKSVQEYKSLRFKLFTNEDDLQNKNIKLKTVLCQLKAAGGKKVQLSEQTISFNNEWIEIEVDLTSAKKGLEYHYIDVIVSGLPVREESAFAKYFRIDEIIFSKKNKK